jgi:hypothetical protein
MQEEYNEVAEIIEEMKRERARVEENMRVKEENSRRHVDKIKMEF